MHVYFAEGCGGKGVLIPKDGELRLARTKPEETPVEVRRLSPACVYFAEPSEGCGGKGVLIPKDGELRQART